MRLNDPPEMVPCSTKPFNAKYSQIEIEAGDAELYILGKVIGRIKTH